MTTEEAKGSRDREMRNQRHSWTSGERLTFVISLIVIQITGIWDSLGSVEWVNFVLEHSGNFIHWEWSHLIYGNCTYSNSCIFSLIGRFFFFCSKSSCFEYKVGLEHLKRSFPTLLILWTIPWNPFSVDILVILKLSGLTPKEKFDF